MGILQLFASLLGLARNFFNGTGYTLHQSYNLGFERLNLSATVAVADAPLPDADTTHETPMAVVEALLGDIAEVQGGLPTTLYYSWEITGAKPATATSEATEAEWANLTVVAQKL